MKGFNWNELIRFPCPVSSLNETLLRVIRDRLLKRTIVVRTGDKCWFDYPCVLAHRAKQRAYRVRSCRRTQADWNEYRVARRRAQLVHEDAERAFTEQSKALLTNALNPRNWWSTEKTAVFSASSSLPPLVDIGGKLV